MTVDAVRDRFRAYVVERTRSGVRKGVRTIDQSKLPADGVLIRVIWSGVNYKDALVTSTASSVAKISPIIPGTDLAGTVVGNPTSDFHLGSDVIAHGFDLGVGRHGGFAEYARVPPEWALPLPSGLLPRDAMAIGTAGFTAALMVMRLQERGILPAHGPVVVTGASGGVGSACVELLAARGYVVDIVSNRQTSTGYRLAGVNNVLSIHQLNRQAAIGAGPRWVAAIDVVGSVTIPPLIRMLRSNGILLCTGNTSGSTLQLDLDRLVESGIELVGIESTRLHASERRRTWSRLATDLRPTAMIKAATEVSLDDLDQVLQLTLDGRARGRSIIRLDRGSSSGA